MIKAPKIRTAKERLGNIGAVKSIKSPSKSLPKAKVKPLKLREGGNVSRETKGGADELTLLLARQGEVSRGQAFQAARSLGLAEFDWKDPETGKLGRFHTRMAGEPDPSAQRGLKLPKGMKESDLYRDPAREQPMRDSEARQRGIEAEYQQNLRNIRSEFETADKRDLQQYTSDMAPFERDQELRGEAARDLENLRAYEAREAAEAALQEAEEPGRVRRHNEIQQLRALQNQLQQEVYRNEQAALQREIDESEQKVLQEWAAGKRKEQALEPVYPEMLAPVGRGAVSTGQGMARMIDRLLRGRSKSEAREEPGILTYPPVREYAKGGLASTDMTRATDRGPRTNVLSDKGMSALDLMKGMKAGEAPKTQDTARAQLDDVLRQLKLRERAVQNATRGLSRDTFGAPTLEQPLLTQGSLTKRRFAEGGDVSRETMSPEEQPVTEESSASKALKRLIEPVREGAKGYFGFEPTDVINPTEAFRTGQALSNMPGVGAPGAIAAGAVGLGSRALGKAAEASKRVGDLFIDTPQFKNWFGESRVVGKGGKPLVVYHSTSAKDDFSVFSEQSHFGTAVAANQRVKDRPEGPARVYPVYLSIRNPLRVSDAEASDEATLLNAIKRGKYKDIDLNTANQKGAIEALKEAGYDGLVYKNNMEDRGKDSWVAFSPTQIKSAIGNEGTFDPTSKVITKAKGGEVNKHDAFIAQNMQTGGEAKKDDGPRLSAMSRLMDFIAQRLPPEPFPTAARTLLESVQGKKDPITEASFSKEELDILRRLTSSGRGSVNYKDYANLVEQLRKEGQDADASPSLFSLGSPVGNVRSTLGRFAYSRDPQGNIIIVDKYDFNPPPAVGMTQEARTADYGFFGPYNMIREYAGEKLPPGYGRDVRINLGNPVPPSNDQNRNKR